MQIRFDVKNDNEHSARVFVSLPFDLNPNLLIVEKAKLTDRIILETLSDEQLKGIKETIEDIEKNGRITKGQIDEMGIW